MSAPVIQFFAGRCELFTQDGSRWRRLSVAEEAHDFTGFDRQTRETSLGVSIERRPNGLLRIAFDLWKLDVNLQPAAIERLEKRWQQEASAFSKPLLRSVNRRVHFSKSFAQFEVTAENVEGWKNELVSVLENPESFEPIESRTEK